MIYVADIIPHIKLLIDIKLLKDQTVKQQFAGIELIIADHDSNICFEIVIVDINGNFRKMFYIFSFYTCIYIKMQIYNYKHYSKAVLINGTCIMR